MKAQRMFLALLLSIILITSSASVSVYAKYSLEIPDALMCETVNFLSSNGVFASAASKWNVYDATASGPTGTIPNATLNKVTNTYVESVPVTSVQGGSGLYVGAFQNSQNITMFTQKADGTYSSSCGAAKFLLDNNDILDGQDYTAVIGVHKASYYDFRDTLSWEGKGNIATVKTAELDISRYSDNAYVIVGIMAQENAQLDSTYISLASYKVKNSSGVNQGAAIRAVTGVPISRYYDESEKGTYKEIAIPLTDFDVSNDWVVSKLALNAVARPDGFPDDYKIPVNYSGFLGMGMMKTRTEDTPSDDYAIFATKFQIAQFNEATEDLRITDNGGSYALSWVKPRNNCVSHYQITAVNGNETKSFYVPVSELSQSAGIYTWNLPNDADSRSLFKVCAVAGELVGNEDVGYFPIYSDYSTASGSDVHTAVLESVDSLLDKSAVTGESIALSDGMTFDGYSFSRFYKGGVSDINNAKDGGYAVFGFEADSETDLSDLYFAIGSSASDGTKKFSGVRADRYIDKFDGYITVNIPIADFANSDCGDKNIDYSRFSSMGFISQNGCAIKADRLLIIKNDINISVSADDATDKEVLISWQGANTIVNKYTVYRDDVAVAEIDGTETSYTDTPPEGFEFNKEYKYRITADAECGFSFESNELTVLIPALDMPRNFDAKTKYNTTASPEIVLSWDEPDFGEDVRTGYEIYRNGTLLATIGKDAVSYSDTDLEYGAEYEYYVRSVGMRESETVYSFNSPKVSAVAVCLLSPENLSLSANGTKLSLSWSAVENASRYRVYIGGKLKDETVYTSSIIAPDKLNTYFDAEVTAVNAGGAESMSAKCEKVYVADPLLSDDEIILYDDIFAVQASTLNNAELTERDTEVYIAGNSSAKMDFTNSSYPSGIVNLDYKFNAQNHIDNGDCLTMQLKTQNPKMLENTYIALGMNFKITGTAATIWSKVKIADYAQSTANWQYISVPFKDFPSTGEGMGEYKTAVGNMDFNNIIGLRFIYQTDNSDTAVMNIDDLMIKGYKSWCISDIIRDLNGNEIDKNAVGAIDGMRILFDMPMNTKTLAPSMIKLLKADGSAVAYYGETDSDNAYKMYFAEPLLPNSAYTLSITASSKTSDKNYTITVPLKTGSFDAYDITDANASVNYTVSYEQEGADVTLIFAPDTDVSYIADSAKINISYNNKVLSPGKTDKLFADLTGDVKITDNSGVMGIELSGVSGLNLNDYSFKVPFKVIGNGSCDIRLSGEGSFESMEKAALSGSKTIIFSLPDDSDKSSGGKGTGGSGSGSGTSADRPSASAGNNGGTNNGTGTFGDLAGYEWAKQDIENLYKNKIINGYEDGTFRPGDKITREEFAKLIVAVSKLSDETSDIEFTDVPKNAWFSGFVSVAAKYGLVNGIGNGEFGTGRYITREDMCAIAERAIKLSKAEVNYIYDDMVFDDTEEISGYALESVRELYRQGFVNGVGNNKFAPKEYVNRAMAAKILNTFYRLVN